MRPARRPRIAFFLALIPLVATLAIAANAAADDDSIGDAKSPEDGVETMTVIGRQPRTATSKQTIPADDFELRPLESGGQMLEAVPNLVTAQHTGGGKAEQYFLRGFDADHGTDLAVYFDGVPMNLRSHAHGQGFLDLHFVTPETIDRLDAHKGPYYTRYGDFATAATVEYVPRAEFEESLVKVAYGEFDTFRAVGVVSPNSELFGGSDRARGYLSFEAYHTDGPFDHDENLWRYSAFARGEVDVSPDVVLSGHLMGYYGEWDASGLIPKSLVRDGTLDRFGSLDPTEGGHTTRVQGKLQLDWDPFVNGHLMANAYLSYYDFELFSNFTYFLVDQVNGDGIVQRDKDRVYAGGRIEYVHVPEAPFFVQLRGGLETRFDDARVELGRQTRRQDTETSSDDDIQEYSLEPYADIELEPLPWVTLQGGLRFAWFHFDVRDDLAGRELGSEDDTRWLPKANLHLSPFASDGPLALDVDGLRNLDVYVNFGIGYHSNDARARFTDPSRNALTKATGTEVGLHTRLFDRIDLALDGWYLNLKDELVFVGDEGGTESGGETNRMGVEFATTIQLPWGVYVRGDIAYTSARLDDDDDTPLAQAPRFVAKAATGWRYEAFATELGLRHLGERYATEDDRDLRLSDYTVLDFSALYRFGHLEIGFAIENLTDTNWSSSEFYYTSQPDPAGTPQTGSHFSPGNPRNVRAWLTGYF